MIATTALMLTKFSGPLVQWYGGGGGERLYEQHAGQWRMLSGGGGAMGSDMMASFGVPKADWCPFGIYDAKC